MEDALIIDHVSRLLSRQGADAKQAVVMAAQLLKRARQMALQERVDEARALQYLLQVVISSRNGTPPPHKPWGTQGAASGIRAPDPI